VSKFDSNEFPGQFVPFTDSAGFELSHLNVNNNPGFTQMKNITIANSFLQSILHDPITWVTLLPVISE